MDSPSFIRIRSWHVFRNWTRVPGGFVTRCGRRATVDPTIVPMDALPVNEPSCERCLQLVELDRKKPA